MKILIIGNNTRSMACSAKDAGYTVYALDNFFDLDMQKCSDKARFIGNLPVGQIPELAGSFGEFDAVVLGPGFEKLRFDNILNNSQSVIEEVNDKLMMSKKFASMGLPHPHTELLIEAKGDKFPLMIKPRSGSGGMRNYLVTDENQLSDLKARDGADDFIAQEFVDGIPCSASLIGTRDDAVVVALNEQLIGVPWLTGLPFAYCGNITPFRTEFSDEMKNYARRIAVELRLVGSNGVDFVLTERGVVVIEVNPRFQGSIDTVELSCNLNIFDAHVKSFSGELPEPPECACFAGKAILYSNKKLVVNEALSERLIECMNMKCAADIPGKGEVIHPDEPVTTLIGTGKTRRSVIEKLERYAKNIRGKLKVL